MAKRAKAARGAEATTHQGSRRPGKAAKAKAEEPFFRPFAALARPPKAQAGAAAGAATTAVTATGAAAAATAATAPRAAAQPARAVEPPPRRVDPETFAIYMAGVRALEDRAHRIPATADRVERAPAPPAPTADPDEGARANLRALVVEGLRFEITDDGQRIAGRRLDVDPRELRHLRRAQYAVDSSLDLRALRGDAARAAVEDFIHKRRAEGDRVVAIDHGEGLRSPGGQGVLRGEVAAWLSQGRVARHVAAFATAPDPSGGSGALLVLLAR